MYNKSSSQPIKKLRQKVTKPIALHLQTCYNNHIIN